MAGSYDLVVIGSGPGGYVAAIRAAQLGLKVAVVEKDRVGGRCPNYACIPAKTMLHTADVYDELVSGGAELGVKVEGASIDWQALGARRDKIRDAMSGGVSTLLKKNKVELIEGEGSLTAGANVAVGGDELEAGAVILATGSVSLPIPGVEFGGRVVDTWGAWSLPELPKRIAVVGSGASGAEIASGYGRFGAEVLLIEMLDQILPAEDADVAKLVERAFKKQKIAVTTGAKVEDVKPGKSSVKFKYGGESAEVDYLVIAAGRGPDTEALKLGDAGVETEDSGRIKVDEVQRTSNEKVFAIGDIVRGPALAHKASEEGIVAAEAIADHPTHPLDLDLVPGATFCQPQVGSVGMTEAQAKEAGIEVTVAKYQLGGVGAGTVYDDRQGFVKIIAEKKLGEIVGCHIVGRRACDMISEVVNVIALEGGIQELARIVHPHPTISEAIPEAARLADGWVIHG